jgi:hypothetical protein
MKKLFALLLSVQIMSCIFGQGLESIPPVLIRTNEAKNVPDVSFILTPAGRMEIIDAKQPWPPRWFAPSNYTERAGADSANVHLTYMNPRMENGYFAFFESTSSRLPQSVKNNGNSFIVI